MSFRVNCLVNIAVFASHMPISDIVVLQQISTQACDKVPVNYTLLQQLILCAYEAIQSGCILCEVRRHLRSQPQACYRFQSSNQSPVM